MCSPRHLARTPDRVHHTACLQRVLLADLHERAGPLDSTALDLLFRQARSHNGWLQREVPESLIRELYEITRWGPTSMNCCPARFVFVTSAGGKERLRPALAASLVR